MPYKRPKYAISLNVYPWSLVSILTLWRIGATHYVSYYNTYPQVFVCSTLHIHVKLLVLALLHHEK